MAGSLTLSTKLSPFPWAAAAIATYTEKAELSFDEANTGVTLVFDGSQITDEAHIVQTLAKAGGLADQSTKVRRSVNHPNIFCLINAPNRLKHTSSLQSLSLKRPLCLTFSLPWIHLMTI